MIYKYIIRELELGSIILPDYELLVFSAQQRISIVVIVLILFVLSIIGNAATLIVSNKSSGIRPFFRTCLISLACSDLLNTISLAVSFLSQYSSTYAQVWELGGVLCKILPFLTIMGHLVNSMTLVAIALDRYLAVIKIIRGTWEPGIVICTAFVIIIWGVSAGASSPILCAYNNYQVQIMITDPKNVSDVKGFETAYFCTVGKKEGGLYHLTIFFIMFIPIVVAFIWLNMVISCVMWNRWKIMNKGMCSTSTRESTSSTMASNMMSERINSKSAIDYGIARDQRTNTNNRTNKRTHYGTRQLRTIFVIFILMIMFMLCRMPLWIYLIMKLFGTYKSINQWFHLYCFGILSLFNSVLNPLLYTFLTQTIYYINIIRKKIQNYSYLRRFFVGPTKSANNPLSGNAGSAGTICIISANK